ncbi:MAG: dihydroneopterin aldolase [Burkholderiaceae bacterium]|jgi:dihydroneopterin aldolase
MRLTEPLIPESLGLSGGSQPSTTGHDQIVIEELEAEALVGVYECERTAPQPLVLGLHIGLASRRAGLTDELADTIDYAQVVARVRETLTQTRYFLLEALAEHIANLLLDEFGAAWARVSVSKPSILANVGPVGVSIERVRTPSALEWLGWPKHSTTRT